MYAATLWTNPSLLIWRKWNVVPLVAIYVWMIHSTMGADGTNINDHMTPSSSPSSHTTTDASIKILSLRLLYIMLRILLLWVTLHSFVGSVVEWFTILQTTSPPYQDAFEYTVYSHEGEWRAVWNSIGYAGNKLGESILCTFLVKDWQWIDIMARKYGTRAFWYGTSSDGYQEGHGYTISSRSTIE